MLVDYPMQKLLGTIRKADITDVRYTIHEEYLSSFKSIFQKRLKVNKWCDNTIVLVEKMDSNA